MRQASMTFVPWDSDPFSVSSGRQIQWQRIHPWTVETDIASLQGIKATPRVFKYSSVEIRTLMWPGTC